MNLLKSMFISMYMMLIMMVAGYAGWMLFQNGFSLGWLGVLLTTAPILMIISFLMMFKSMARTSAHFPLPNAMGLIGVALAFWDWFNGNTDLLVPVIASIGWIGFILYAYWFSSFGDRPSDKISVGSKLPDFTLRKANGEIVSSKQLTDKPAILIFYRGNWCPLCMAQIKELVKKYKTIEELGVRLALISPQPHSNTEALAKKFGVSFDFLTDEGNKAARKLGIEMPNGLPMGMQMMGYASETVLPTVIITDQSGKVVWKDETDNYRIRPEPDTYLAVIQRHQLAPASV
ncbi:MAG: peroxiredoxin family protein [Gammaproteobacteria bacterium]